MKFLLFFLIFLTQIFANSLSKQEILDLQNRINAIDSALSTNIWAARFTNSQNYKNLQNELEGLEKARKNIKISDNLTEIDKKIKNTKERILLLTEYQKAPFSDIIMPPDLNSTLKVTNAFSIISGISYIKKLNNDKESYIQRLKSLDYTIEKLTEKSKLLEILVNFDENLTQNYEITKKEINELQDAKEIGKISLSVYQKKLNEEINIIQNDIKTQIKKTINIGIFIIIIVLVSLLCKYIVKKTITDNERFYTANKAINLISISLILLTLFFAYIENASYFITILGFASAGLAIAMKDMFMSILGWSVIIFGGAMHVGDRIKVSKNGVTHVGDIIDISLLRITIYEDITYTTYLENRRSGRIIFVPNNYIFTDLISNYTHSGMKTVWDGIDIMLSFDSNHKKAMYIIKNIVRKYSKGYTDIAKKTMNHLRSQYSIKNPNVEPRIFSFLEAYGVKISVWYMTDACATLGLRSTISGEIIEALLKENDIKIAYPTQTLFRGIYPKPPVDLTNLNEEILY